MMFRFVCLALLAALATSARAQTFVAPLDGVSPPSTFQPVATTLVPAFGWSADPGTVQIDDDGVNGYLVHADGGPRDPFVATFVLADAVVPGDTYTLSVDLGFASDTVSNGPIADYDIEIGASDAGNVAPLADTGGQVGSLGNIADGVISGSDSVSFTAPTTFQPGLPIVVVVRAIDNVGPSDFLAFDNIRLTVTTPSSGGEGEGEGAGEGEGEGATACTFIGGLDDASLSSTFETGSNAALPQLGWENVQGTATIFDVNNGALIHTLDDGFANYQVQYVLPGDVYAANTTYTLHVDMGYAAGLAQGVDHFRAELGTIEAGSFVSLASKQDVVVYAGNITSGTISGSTDVTLAATTAVGEPIVVRWAQLDENGGSDFFGIDNVTLAACSSTSGEGEGEGEGEGAGEGEGEGQSSCSEIGALDDAAPSSTFETGIASEALPAAGWADVSSTAEIVDVDNGFLTHTADGPFDNYEVEYVVPGALYAGGSYTVHVDMGFDSDTTGGVADYRLELGSNVGSFSAFASKTGSVVYAGNISSGIISDSADVTLDVTTPSTFDGFPIVIRFTQTGTNGASELLAIDNVTLTFCPTNPVGEGEGEGATGEGEGEGSSGEGEGEGSAGEGEGEGAAGEGEGEGEGSAGEGEGEGSAGEGEGAVGEGEGSVGEGEGSVGEGEGSSGEGEGEGEGAGASGCSCSASSNAGDGGLPLAAFGLVALGGLGRRRRRIEIRGGCVTPSV